MKKLFTALSIASGLFFASVSVEASMIPNEEGQIEINGKKQPMLWHILDLSEGASENPFQNTHIVKHEENTFEVVGLVSSCPQDCLELIMKNNYTYIPFYTMAKAGGPEYKNFGAILVGHKDTKLADGLHFAAMKSLISAAKK